MMRRGSSASWSKGMGSILGITYLLSTGARVSRCWSLTKFSRLANLMPIDPSSVMLTDRVAVVTGGGSGIGRGIARGLTAFGARVAIWERNAETAAAAAEEIGGLGITTDVRESAEVDAALARTV